MRRLMLMRHAKTERNAPSGKDRDRRLEARGREDAAAMAEWLAQNGYTPDAVLVSSAVRARETWTLMSPSMPNASAEIIEDIYTADASELLRIVHNTTASGATTLGVVGHNPTLHELALCLVKNGSRDQVSKPDDMPTMGVAAIDFAVDDWSGIAFRGGSLKLFQSPKMLNKQTENK